MDVALDEKPRGDDRVRGRAKTPRHRVASGSGRQEWWSHSWKDRNALLWLRPQARSH